MAIAVVLEGATAIAWLAAVAFRRGPVRWHGAAIATIPFLVYGAANAAWVTPVPWLGWRDWMRWAEMAAVFWVAVHGVRGRRPREALLAGMVLLGIAAVAMAVYQWLGDPRWLMLGRHQGTQFIGRCSGPFGIPNSLGALMGLLLPAVLALAFRRGSGVRERVFFSYVAALFLLGLVLTMSRGAWLAVGAALAAWPLLAARRPKKAWRWSAVALAAAGALVVVISLKSTTAAERFDQLWLNHGERSRLMMWRGGWGLFCEHPVLGTGAGSYGTLFERHRPAGYLDGPLAAHNEYLNMASDYGAVGFVLSFGVAGCVAVLVLRRRREAGGGAARAEGRFAATRAGLAIGLLAFALQMFVDFSLRIPALAQAVAIAAALVLGTEEIPASAAHASRRLPRLLGCAAASLGIAAFAVFRAVPLYQAEGLRVEAAEAMEKMMRRPPPRAEKERVLQRCRGQLAEAVRLDPANGSAWGDSAKALLLCAETWPDLSAALGREAVAAASTALERSPMVPEFWLWRAFGFDRQERWRDAWADFTQALAIAPRRADIWRCYAWHLSLHDISGARMALATSLALDPWNEEALALQRRFDGRR